MSNPKSVSKPKSVAKFQLYKDVKNDWRWRVVAKNGRIISESSEGYERKAKCIKSIDITIKALSQFMLAPVDVR